MNKEEILAKSRQENKDRDLYELSIDKNASRVGIIVMYMIVFILTMVNVFQNGRLSFALWTVAFSVDTSMYIYKAVKLRTKKSIVSAVVTLIADIVATCLFFGNVS